MLSQRAGAELFGDLVKPELSIETARVHERLRFRNRVLLSRAQKCGELEEQAIDVEWQMAVLPRARCVGRSATGQGTMRCRYDHDRSGVIEDRVVSQCRADVDAVQIFHPLIEQQHIEWVTARQLERLLAGAGPRGFVPLLHEHALQRAGHPLVRTPDQGGEPAREVRGHGATLAAGVVPSGAGLMLGASPCRCGAGLWTTPARARSTYQSSASARP